MKAWLIYFLCIAIVISGVLFATDRLIEAEDMPRLLVCIKGEILEMSTEEFALRILLAEGQDCKSIEAKKALAVAARSCGVYLSAFGCKHDDFDLCDDGKCCFNLADPMTAESEFLAECILATEETFGTCLTHENLPAMALFSRCNGSGSRACPDFTYLTAVKESLVCQEHKSEATLDYSTLCQLAERDKEEIIQNSTLIYGDNRKCEFAIIGGRLVYADELTDALGFKSREFVLSFGNDGINAQIYGVGNGFGLSICGCEAMAQKGDSFEKIIEYYYPNLTVNKIYQS